jgi:hypothetical protein
MTAGRAPRVTAAAARWRPGTAPPSPPGWVTAAGGDGGSRKGGWAGGAATGRRAGGQGRWAEGAAATPGWVLRKRSGRPRPHAPMCIATTRHAAPVPTCSSWALSVCTGSALLRASISLFKRAAREKSSSAMADCRRCPSAFRADAASATDLPPLPTSAARQTQTDGTRRLPPTKAPRDPPGRRRFSADVGRILARGLPGLRAPRHAAGSWAPEVGRTV